MLRPCEVILLATERGSGRSAPPSALPRPSAGSKPNSWIASRRWPKRQGPPEMRLSPWRTVYVGARDTTAALHAVDAARLFGLIVDSDDPLLRIEACPGAPACRSSSVDTRGDARRLAASIGAVRRHASMSRVAPRAARARRRPIWCWSARTVVTASCATARRAVRSSASSARKSYRPCSRNRAMAEARAYIRDGAEIYRRSFAIIRAEADLARFAKCEERVAVRIIHACGMTEIARDIVMSPGFADTRAGRWWRRADPVRFQDGGERHHARAPAGRQRGRSARSTIRRCPELAPQSATRAPPPRWNCGASGWPARSSPSAMRRPRLFRLLEMLDAGAPPPAAVIGLPVGFVGAARIEGGAGGRRPRAVPDRARPQGRQRHGRGRGQCAGERAE